MAESMALGTPPAPSLSLNQYVFDLTRGHRTVLAGAILLSVVSALTTIVQPRLLQKAVNDGITGHLTSPTVEALASLVILTTLVNASQAYLAGRGSEAVAHNLRSLIGKRYVMMSIPDRDAANTADLLSRATVDSLMVKQFLSAGILPVFGSLLMIVGMAVFMITSDPLLFVVTAAAFIVGLLLVLAVSSRANRMSADVQASLGRFSVSVDRALAALRIVKANNAQNSELTRLVKFSADVYHKSMRITRLSAWIQPALNVCIQGAIAIVIIVGAERLTQGTLSLGGLLAYLMYMFMMIVPIGTLGQALTQTQVGLGALRRCHELEFFETETTSGRDDIPQRTTATDAILEFDDVTFGYDPDVPIVQSVSFAVGPGERLNLIGRSGSGKTTLLELAERFYQPTSGHIYFKGAPIEHLDLHDYRNHLALVPQDTTILSGTLRDNLLLGRTVHEDDELRQVLRTVGLTDLLGKPDFDLDTDLGQAGITLSGGQRQRIIWAQVLLSDADVVLMDEPDTGLDPISRRALAKILDQFTHDRTLIVVSHGTDHLNPDGRVLVMADGRVAADGHVTEVWQSSDSVRHLLAAPYAA